MIPSVTIVEQLRNGPVRVTLTGVKKFPTIFVKVKATGTECWINESDFDPAKHQKARTPRLRPVIARPASIRHNPEEVAMTREVLSELTLEQLKDLPQFTQIAGSASITTKVDAITALLAASGVEDSEEEEEEETEA